MGGGEWTECEQRQERLLKGSRGTCWISLLIIDVM